MQYEKQIEKLVYKTFIQELKSVFVSTKMLLVILFGFFYFFFLKNILDKTNFTSWFLDYDFVFIFLILIISGVYHYLIFKKIKQATKINWWGDNSLENYWELKVMSIPKLNIISIIIGASVAGSLSNSDFRPFNYYLFLLFFTFLMILSLLRTIAQYKTYIKLKNNLG
jgi:hypothetical protein